MSDAITSAIESAVADAGGGDDAVDTSAGGNDTPAEVVADGGSGAAVEAAGTAESDPKTPAADDLAAELDALGIKAPKQGERENRIPYSRMLKIVENAKKKLADEHKAVVAAEQAKFTKAEQELINYRKADELFKNDPERYLDTLAVLNPAYKKFRGGTTAPEAEKQAADAAATPMPQPDGRYDDGTLGYTVEGQKKLDEWKSEQIEMRAFNRAKAEFDKQFKPVKDREQAAAFRAEKMPAIQRAVADATEMWGKAFVDDYNKANSGQSEILKMLQANDGQQGRPFMTFEQATAKVLLPKMQEANRVDQNAMRAKLLKELKDAPKAAARHTPSAAAIATADDGPRDMEDVIRESIAGMK